MLDPDLQRALHAARVPGDVELEWKAPPLDRTDGVQPAGHGEEQLHPPDAHQRQRLGDPDLVVHRERDVGTLLTVPHGDVVQLHRVR
jgi:hypothetical protein